MKTLVALRGLPLRNLAALYELTLGLNLVGIAGHFLFAQAVGLSLPIWTIGWIRSAVLALGLLPLSIGGIGVREASLVYLLNLHGASMEQAVTYSALVVLSTLGVALLGAGSELAYVLRRRRAKSQTPSRHAPRGRDRGS
jgi:uncharacterized membrane protein YbhN (UPF0104 family)